MSVATMTLFDFLLARIAEDEARAHRVTKAYADDEHFWAPSVVIMAGALVSPDRILADCEAKRRLMDVVFSYEGTIDSEWGCVHDGEAISRGQCPHTPIDGIEAFRILALPYAAHPDYRQEWTP